MARKSCLQIGSQQIKSLANQNRDELKKFDDTYSFLKYGFRVVDWTRVATLCDGIVFASDELYTLYQPDFEHWAYGMDVASVCVWNTSKLGMEKVNCRILHLEVSSIVSKDVLTKNDKRALRRRAAFIRKYNAV